MQIIRLPPGNYELQQIVQIRHLSSLKDLDHAVEIGDLSEA